MDQNRIKRGALYFFITLAAALAGFFVKKVLIEGGVFSLSMMEIIETTISAALVGVLVPMVEAKKKASR